MGTTPNHDRVARKAPSSSLLRRQSAPLGRAALSPGQSVIRPAQSKGVLARPEAGLPAETDPSIRELLRPWVTATAIRQKNHFGDRDDICPTMHRLRAFFGKPVITSMPGEPELRHPPKRLSETFKRISVPGVCCIAGQRRRNRASKSRPATKKRMETADEGSMKRPSAHQGAWPSANVLRWFNTPHATSAQPVPRTFGHQGCNRNHDVMIFTTNCIGRCWVCARAGHTTTRSCMYSTDNGRT